MRRLLAAMVVLSLLVLPSGGYAHIEVNNTLGFAPDVVEGDPDTPVGIQQGIAHVPGLETDREPTMSFRQLLVQVALLTTVLW